MEKQIKDRINHILLWIVVCTVLVFTILPNISAISVSDCAAIGGNTSVDGNYCIHIFYTNDTFQVNSLIQNAEVLVVAGGGAGGNSTNNYGGGGGAGGIVYNSSKNINLGSYSIIIGAGGAAPSGGNAGNNGANSSFDDMIAIGGGGGGLNHVPGLNGGSGGGSGHNAYEPAGAGSSIQTNLGGTGYGNSGGPGTYAGDGGGGAGQAGQEGTTDNEGGKGGYGINYSISGTEIEYACGGGGSGTTAMPVPLGGCSSAGNGSSYENVSATNALPNSGSGGGGGAAGVTAGDGGSGVVIIKYELTGLSVSLLSHWTLDVDGTDKMNFKKLIPINSPELKTEGCKIGNCYYFDGSAGFENDTDVNSSGYPSNILSVNLWFKTNDTSENPITAFSYGGSPATEYLRVWSYTDWLGFGSGSTEVRDLSTPQYFDNEWHMLTGITNSTHILLYVDGVEVKNISFNNLAIVEGGIGIGLNKYAGGATFWNGYLDEVMIWNRTITLDEMYALYNLSYILEGETIHPITETNYTLFNTSNYDLNFSINITSYYNLSNVTLYVYNGTSLYNQSNYEFISNTTQSIIGIILKLTTNTYNWFFKGYDDQNNYFSTSNKTLYISPSGNLYNPFNFIKTSLIGNSVTFNCSISSINNNTNLNYTNHWKFDETSGTVIEDNAGDSNLIATDGNQISDGLINYGYQPYDESMVSSIKLENRTAITLNMWIKWNGTDMTNGDTLATNTPGFPEMGIILINSYSNKWRFEFYNPGVNSLGDYDIPANQWSMWTLVINNNNTLVYRNSTLIGNTTMGTFELNDNNLTFFGNEAGGTQLQGVLKVDEFSLFNRALTQSEINSLYNNSSGFIDDSSLGPDLLELNLLINDEINYTIYNTTENQTELSLEIIHDLPTGNYNWSCSALNEEYQYAMSDYDYFSIYVNTSGIPLNDSNYTLYNKSFIDINFTLNYSSHFNNTTDEIDYNMNFTNSTLYIYRNLITSGGNITTDGDYIVHTFYANDTFYTSSDLTNVTMLIVGGGGAGGAQNNEGGGGGGAGGLLYSPSYNISRGVYNITIGLGGISPGNSNQGDNGGNTSFDSIIAYGGGGGGASSFYPKGQGLPGGSGGGNAPGDCVTSGNCGATSANFIGYSNQPNYTGFTSYGTQGGYSLYFELGYTGGGGGGGANFSGRNASGATGGSGGDGLCFNITGTTTCYAGGGGAGYTNAGLGGLGGGGNGSNNAPTNATSGINGTGSGGGGQGYTDTLGGTAGSGGSGIIIIRYLNTSITEYNQTTSTDLNIGQGILGIVVRMTQGIYQWFYDLYNDLGERFVSENQTIYINLNESSFINISLNYPLNNYIAYNNSGSSNQITFNCSAESSYGIKELSLLINNQNVEIITADNSTLYTHNFTYTLPYGKHTWACGALDSNYNYEDPEYNITSTGTINIDILFPQNITYFTLPTTLNYTLTNTSEELNKCWNYNNKSLKEIIITDTSGTTNENISVRFNISYDSMNADFSDIRFYNITSYSHNYWIEEKVDSSWAMVWVKIPLLLANSNYSLYLYYGNTSAISESNIESTFIYGDDFETDTSNRYINNSGCSEPFTVSNGEMTLISNINSYICGVAPNTTYQLINQNYTLEAKIKLGESNGSAYAHLGGFTMLEDTIPMEYTDTEYNLWISEDYPTGQMAIAVWLIGFPNSTSEIKYTHDEWNYITAKASNNLLTFTAINSSNYTKTITSPLTYSSSGYYGLSMYGNGLNNRNVTYDWFIVRKYISSEPNITFNQDSEFNLALISIVDAGNNFTSLVATEGQNNWTVFCNDSLGVENSTTVYFEYITAPIINITYPLNISYNINVSNINYTSAGEEYCWYSIDGGVSNSSSVLGALNFTNVISIEGENTWTVYCNNTGGAVGYNNVTFFKDTIIPQINITYPLNGYNYSNVSYLNYTLIEANPDICIFNNVTENITIICGQNLTLNSTEGINIWTIYVNDTLGNSNYSQVNFILDTIEPNIDITNPLNDSITGEIPVNFNWSLNDSGSGIDNTTIYLYNTSDGNLINQTTIYSYELSDIFNTIVGIPIILTDGIYNWFVDVFDFSGNYNVTENQTFTLDTTVPEINYSQGIDTNSSNISKSWIYVNVSVLTNNNYNTSFTLYNYSDMSIFNQTNFSDNTTQYNWTGLSDGHYAYEVNITGISGLKNSSGILTITLDSTPPILNKIYPSNESIAYVGTNDVTFNFSVNDATSGIYNATIFIYNDTSKELYNNTTYTYDVLNLNNNNLSFTIYLPDGVYLWDVSAYDFANNFVDPNDTIIVDTQSPSYIYYINPTKDNNSYEDANWIFALLKIDDYNLANVTHFLYNYSSGNLINNTTATNYFQVIPDEYYCIDNLGNINNTSCINGADGNWSTYLPLMNGGIFGGNTYIYVNYTNIFSDGNYYWTGKFLGDAYYTNKNSYWNYTLNNWQDIGGCVPYTNITDNIGTNTRAAPFEYCYNFTPTNTGTVDIDFLADYSGFYPYATIRIRDNNTNLIEEMNDTNRDNSVSSSTYLIKDTLYGICLANTNATGGNNDYSVSSYPGYTYSGINSATPYFSIQMGACNYTYNIPEDGCTENKIQLRLTSWVSALGEYTYYYEGVLYENMSNSRMNWTNLDDGKYLYNATAFKYTTLNNSSETRLITLDTTNPLINYSGGMYSNNTILNNYNWAYINVSITEPNQKMINFTLYKSNTLYSFYNNSSLFNYGLSSYDYNFTNLPDGNYSFNVTFEDQVNRTNTTPKMIIVIDMNAPNATLISPINNTNTSSTSINFTVDANDSVGLKNATLFVYNATGLYSNTTTYYIFNPEGITSQTIGVLLTVVEGTYRWFFKVFDMGGLSTDTQNYSLDVITTYPNVSTIFPVNGINYTNMTTVSQFNYTVSGTNLSQCWYSINGGVNSTPVNYGINFTGLVAIDQSSNTYTVYCNNIAGLVGYNSTTFNLDITAPSIDFVSPSSVNYAYANGTINLEFTATDNFLSNCWYYYNGTNNSISCNSGVPVTTSLSLIGTKVNMTNNMIIIYANDTHGNLASYVANYYYKIFENARYYNTTTFETAYEEYIIDVNGTGNASITAIINYNGTLYDATKSTTSDDRMNFTFTHAVPVGVSNNSFTWIFSYTNISTSTINANTSYQNVNLTMLFMTDYACNSTSTTRYAYFDFKDEITKTYINASANQIIWSYWLHTPNVNKTFSFSNSTLNYNYTACFTPNHKTVYTDIDFYFEHVSVGGADPTYPQRHYINTNLILNNSTINNTLYLLNINDGQWVQILTADVTGFAVSGFLIDVYKFIDGVDTLIVSSETDASGSAVFFLSSASPHTFKLSKNGCTNQTNIITPTSSSYTITVSCDTNLPAAPTNISIEGIRYFRAPIPGVIRDVGNTSFIYYVDSSIRNISKARFAIAHSNRTIIAINESFIGTDYCNVSSCYLTLIHDVSIGNDIKGAYWVDLGYGYILLENDARWRFIKTNVTDARTISNFFSRMKDFMGSWHVVNEGGLDCENFTTSYTGCLEAGCYWANDTNTCYDFNVKNRQEYSRIVFVFLILAIILAIFGRITGYDAQNPGVFLLFLTAVVAFGSFANGLGGEGYFYYTDLTPWKLLNNFFLLITTGFISLGYWASVTRRNT